VKKSKEIPVIGRGKEAPVSINPHDADYLCGEDESGQGLIRWLAIVLALGLMAAGVIAWRMFT
jgi:hypothetical protein